MSDGEMHAGDRAPGDAADDEEIGGDGLLIYSSGLGLALLLTLVSFVMVHTNLVWKPSIPVALGVLAVAQMGVHLVFFIRITSGPDNTNNILALAFGVLITVLVMGGSLFIMDHLNANMEVPMDRIMEMQR